MIRHDDKTTWPPISLFVARTRARAKRSTNRHACTGTRRQATRTYQGKQQGPTQQAGKQQAPTEAPELAVAEGLEGGLALRLGDVAVQHRALDLDSLVQRQLVGLLFGFREDDGAAVRAGVAQDHVADGLRARGPRAREAQVLYLERRLVALERCQARRRGVGAGVRRRVARAACLARLECRLATRCLQETRGERADGRKRSEMARAAVPDAAHAAARGTGGGQGPDTRSTLTVVSFLKYLVVTSLIQGCTVAEKSKVCTSACRASSAPAPSPMSPTTRAKILSWPGQGSSESGGGPHRLGTVTHLP